MITSSDYRYPNWFSNFAKGSFITAVAHLCDFRGYSYNIMAIINNNVTFVEQIRFIVDWFFRQTK